MKRNLLAIFFLVGSLVASAEDNEIVKTATTLANNKIPEVSKDSLGWNFPGSVGINANQAYFNDYCMDGTGSSASLDAYLNLNANYKSNKILWMNAFSAKYGFIYSSEFTGDDLLRKNMDEFNLSTKFGYKARKSLYYSVLSNVESQFSKGYEYIDDVNGIDSATVISEFFAPGYFKVSLGMDYIPNKYISVFASPATARFTFCRVESLAPNYSMELDETTGEYAKYRAEIGAYLKVSSDFDITKSLHFKSTLEGFLAYNKAVQTYTDGYVDWYGAHYEEADFDAESYTKDEYVDINGWYVKWKVEFLFKLSKYINLSFKTQLKYDNAETKVVEDKNFGLPEAKLQYWESTSLGIAYKF